MIFYDVPYEITNCSDIYKFVQSRAVHFDNFPFLLIKSEHAELKTLENVILKVKTGTVSLRNNEMGHFDFSFEKARNTKAFNCDWCFDEASNPDCIEEHIEKATKREKETWNKSKNNHVVVKNFWTDIQGSIIKTSYGSDNSSHPLPLTPLWNLKSINYEMNENKNPLLLFEEAKDVDGITKPFAYYGYPYSAFPLHREDLDLCSVNYLHQGKPKIWYGFKAKDNERIIAYLKTIYAFEYSLCEQAFRHKNFFLNLEKLQAYFPDLKIFRVIQEPGHFVITGPAVFHQGYNEGYNIAEAVNFGIPSWKPFLASTNSCFCLPSSWKVARQKLQKLGDVQSWNLKINSSVFRIVRSSQFLVIAYTRDFSQVQEELATLKIDKVVSKWFALKPIESQPAKTLSVYTFQLFQVTCGKPILFPVEKKPKVYRYQAKKPRKLSETPQECLYQIEDKSLGRYAEDIEDELRHGESERSSSNEKEAQGKKFFEKSVVTTLNQFFSVYKDLLKKCFILPFTSEGQITVSESTWDASFQIKWSFLEKIFKESHWHQNFQNLKKPTKSSFQQTHPEFPTVQAIQNSFQFDRINVQQPKYFSLSAKVQYGGHIDVAIVDYRGHLRLHTTLDMTSSSKEEFWKHFQLLEKSILSYHLIVAHKSILKNLLLIPKGIESKLILYEMTSVDYEHVAFEYVDEYESKNQAFLRSTFCLKHNHKYFKYLDLEDTDASTMARLQLYKVRDIKLNFDELMFTTRLCSIPLRKAYMVSIISKGNNWKLCMIDELETVICCRDNSQKDWHSLNDLGNNIYAIAREYLSAHDYLFHHYLDSETSVVNSLPQLIYLEFPDIKEENFNDDLVAFKKASRFYSFYQVRINEYLNKETRLPEKKVFRRYKASKKTMLKKE